MQLPGLEVNCNNVRRLQLKVSVRVWRLDAVSHCVAKHAVTCHLDIEDMLLAIPELLWQDPFNALTTPSQAL